MIDEPPRLITPDKGKVTAAVIWLHGLGADGDDFASIVPHLSRTRSHTRFIFPHARLMSVTINQGAMMRAWYDIAFQGGQFISDQAGITESAHHLGSMIESEQQKGVPYSRIVVAGFSQGGVIAQHTALRFKAALAGVMALSTYLPPESLPSAENATANVRIPYFLAHGRQDPMLPIARAEKSLEALLSRGYEVEWHAYDMEHTLCPKEIVDIDHWLGDVIPAD